MLRLQLMVRHLLKRIDMLVRRQHILSASTQSPLVFALSPTLAKQCHHSLLPKSRAHKISAQPKALVTHLKTMTTLDLQLHLALMSSLSALLQVMARQP